MEKTLNSKLLDFQKRVGIVKKDSKNPHFKNTYASLTQILSEVKPLLTECGLVLVQPISLDGVGTTIIDCETGEKIETIISLPSNLNPQQLGSAITYFRRYTLASLLALEIDDDDAQSTVKPTMTITEVKIPLTEQVETAKAKIITATTLEDLKAKWSTLNKIEQAFQEVIELKDKLKTTLK
ncbi:MAG: ERF family protein [Proteobacteria bacterium]|jgi:hypothetical protein|nr:ERF family protein [Pseudomonadota bacterium]